MTKVERENLSERGAVWVDAAADKHEAKVEDAEAKA